MTTTMTVKGQVTIPKRVRDALGLSPGDRVEFAVNRHGEIVITRAGVRGGQRPDSFQAVRGAAQRTWRTDELLALLRGED